MKDETPNKSKEMLIRLGSAIKTARLSENKRQRDITKETGLSQNIMTNLEVGKGSSVSSLVTVLDHLNVFETLISLLELNKENINGERVIVKKFKPEPSVVPDPAPKTSDVSLEELLSGKADVIELSKTVKEDELMASLAMDTTRVFRVSRTVVSSLSRDPSSRIAIYTNNVRYVTPGGLERSKEVYYVTTLSNANSIPLAWTVGGFVRNPDAAVDAMINLDDIPEELHQTVEEELDIFLVKLRKQYGEIGVFIDSASIDTASMYKSSMLVKDGREVRGGKYKAMFSLSLNEWLLEMIDR